MNKTALWAKELIVWLGIIFLSLAFMPLVMVGAFFAAVVGGLFSEEF